MKYIITTILSVLLISCTSDTDLSGETASQVIDKAQLVIPDFIYADDAHDMPSKTSLSSSLKFTWSKGDQVGVWPTLKSGEETTASQVLFTLDGGASTNTATFKGSGWGLLHNRKYYAYYPYKADARPDSVHFTYTTECTQATSVSTTHLGINDHLYSSATTPENGSSASFQFHHLTSLVRLNITLPNELKSATLKSVILEAEKPVFPVNVAFCPTDTVPEETVFTKTKRLTLMLGNNGAGFKPYIALLYAWFMTGAIDLEGETLKVTVSDGAKQYTGQFEGVKQRPGYAYQYNVTVAETQLPEGCVDLGFDVYWADKNLGADSPEHFGDYYAWGETKPYYSALTMNEKNSTPTCGSVTWMTGKTSGYAWSSYFDTSDGGSTFKKYKNAGQTLELADDAAYVNLGGHWRMPTTEEVVQLYRNCTLSSAVVGGVKGVRFTSKLTGNSIFIPGNGYFKGITYDCGSTGFRLWSSTQSSKTNAYGWYNGYSALDQDNMQYSRERYRGHGIRPVYDPEQK